MCRTVIVCLQSPAVPHKPFPIKTLCYLFTYLLPNFPYLLQPQVSDQYHSQLS